MKILTNCYLEVIPAFISTDYELNSIGCSSNETLFSIYLVHTALCYPIKPHF